MSSRPPGVSLSMPFFPDPTLQAPSDEVSRAGPRPACLRPRPLPPRTARPACDEPRPARRCSRHDVFFALKDNSAAAKDKLVAACKKYLTKHPGEVFFAAGTLAEDLNRPVNDRDFDVALHIVFADRAAHDKYQDAAAAQAVHRREQGELEEGAGSSTPTWSRPGSKGRPRPPAASPLPIPDRIAFVPGGPG